MPCSGRLMNGYMVFGTSRIADQGPVGALESHHRVQLGVIQTAEVSKLVQDGGLKESG